MSGFESSTSHREKLSGQAGSLSHTEKSRGKRGSLLRIESLNKIQDTVNIFLLKVKIFL